jgi:hypothetical protein
VKEAGRLQVETLDYNRFIQESIVADPAGVHQLTEDEMYGVYLSWCALCRLSPEPCESFWAAMSGLGLYEQHAVKPGLRMAGPAALDYILASRPSLV